MVQGWPRVMASLGAPKTRSWWQEIVDRGLNESVGTMQNT